MKKLLKYSLPIIIIIIYILIGYPALCKRYGDNLFMIRQLVNMLIVMDVFAYANRSISKYGLGTYKYYKLLGRKEISILGRYIKDNYFRYLMYFFLFFVSAYAGDVVSAMLCTMQYILYCNCLVFVLYVLMHEYKPKKILCLTFLVAGIACIANGLWQLFRMITDGVVLTEILAHFFHGTILSWYRAIFFEGNLYGILVAVIVIAFAIFKLHFLDDVSVIEEVSVNKNGLMNEHFNQLIEQKRQGLFRDIRITFRKKENLFSYAAAFGLYVFCCCLFGDVPQLLFGVSYLCIVLINYGLESVYLNDTVTLKIYKLFGEDYAGFLQTKLRISIFINLMFGSVYTIKCIGLNSMKEWFILLLVHITNILYWNMYYSYLYIGMKRYGTLLDGIKRLIAFLIGNIPVLNIGFTILYYKKGRRRWNCYVNNGQGDKEI